MLFGLLMLEVKTLAPESLSVTRFAPQVRPARNRDGTPSSFWNGPQYTYQ